MPIKNKPMSNPTPEKERLRRKANQHWDMAGLARQDGDTKDAERHTKLARDYERKLGELS